MTKNDRLALRRVLVRYKSCALARAANISTSYFHPRFKDTFQKSVKRYVNELRVKQCIVFLTTTNLSVEQIALKVGFKNYSSLYKVFLSITSTTPKNYRNKINDQSFEIQNFKLDKSF